MRSPRRRVPPARRARFAPSRRAARPARVPAPSDHAWPAPARALAPAAAKAPGATHSREQRAQLVHEALALGQLGALLVHGLPEIFEQLTLTIADGLGHLDGHGDQLIALAHAAEHRDALAAQAKHLATLGAGWQAHL